MAVKRSLVLIVSFLLFITSQAANAQVIFKELASSEETNKNYNFFEESSSRKIINLNGNWSVYFSDDQAKKKSKVSVPSFFEGEDELVFEKSFELNQKQLSASNFEIYFLGLSYSADIAINNSLIYRHPGGDFPFSFLLPKDLLRYDKKNVISVKITSNLDSENTIPVKQRFLTPTQMSGIFRDVYVRVVPNIFISSFQSEYKYLSGQNRFKYSAFVKIENKNFKTQADSIGKASLFEINYSIISESDKSVLASASSTVQIPKGKEKASALSFDISPNVWSPEFPNIYLARVQVYQDGNLIDEVIKRISFYNITSGKDSLFLNGKSFQLKGVTYIPSNETLGAILTFSKMEEELKIIKEIGFNSVRFAYNTPHPYMLALCEQYGLLAFVELPLNSIPESIIETQNYLTRSKNYLNHFSQAFADYSAIAGFGLGTGYNSGTGATDIFIKELARGLKRPKPLLVYASFSSINDTEIPELDLYGFEFLNNSFSKFEDSFNSVIDLVGKGKYFVSEAGYIANLGSSSGYTNDYTLEAQAYYFNQLLNFSDDNYYAGYFLHTMFDYRSQYHSIISGYDKEKIIKLGILGENRNLNRITYKVIQAKLNNLEKVTIPLGVKKDDSPMIFIIFGLVLALLVGFLVNTGRKFREDSSRALLRPYNFYADIRDLRIMSGIHTTILTLLVSAVMALITSSVLYYFRTEIIFEKILLAFGCESIMEAMSFLTWQPIYALGTLTIFFIVLILVLTVIVKLGSLFVMNRVFTSNAYFAVSWSFLPIVLTIPAAIVLYRILHADLVNLYIFILLIFFGLWVIYRIIKGIYVIYDVRPSTVYLYSLLIIFGFVGAIVFYFQQTSLMVEYILHYIK